MNKPLLLQGGRVIDPSNNRDKVADVLVHGATIQAVGPDLRATAAADYEVIDCRGKLVLPGPIDTNAHVYQGVMGRFGLNADMCGVHLSVTTPVDQGGPRCIRWRDSASSWPNRPRDACWPTSPPTWWAGWTATTIPSCTARNART